MTEKDKLKKLVNIIGDLLKIEGNEWLIDEILKTIGDTSSIEEISKHSIIQNINEYCIEQKIEKQAVEFYKDFPISELKAGLINDYKKMEHERRRDDFENFCLCMYQQIENITNFLFDNYIVDNWDDNKNKTALMYKEKKISQHDLIFGNATEWYASVKFKAVLYTFYFNENLKVKITFQERVKIFEEIYQVRNQNHRGNILYNYQKDILDKIKGSESKYYLKFYGFLQDFITQIENTMKDSKKILTIKPNHSAEEKRKTANTIGNNPELAKKLENFKNKQ